MPSEKKMVTAAIFISPLLLMSVYLCVTRLGNLTRDFDIVALLLSLASAFPFLLKTKRRIIEQIVVVALYFTVGGVVLWFYSLLFMCIFFSDCL